MKRRLFSPLSTSMDRDGGPRVAPRGHNALVAALVGALAVVPEVAWAQSATDARPGAAPSAPVPSAAPAPPAPGSPTAAAPAVTPPPGAPAAAPPAAAPPAVAPPAVAPPAVAPPAVAPPAVASAPVAAAPGPAREPGTAIMAVSAPPPPLPASALAPLETDPERRKVKHRYRKGFMLTLAFGQSLGAASGYPNDVQKIGVPAYFASSGVMLGGGFQMVIGGALTDYFNFGVLFGGGGFKNDDWEIAAGGTGFRVEAFPAVVAFPKIQALAHLGIAADLGVGNVKIQAKANTEGTEAEKKAEEAKAPRGYTTIEGFQSALGIGLFYETSLFSLLGGHVSLAPELSYRTAYTATSQVNYGTLAARLTYYGGP